MTDKDKEKEEAGSSGAPTNGMNTPANLPEAIEAHKDTPEGQKEGENADGAVPEITAEEAEWLQELRNSQIAWYPWPSNDKIRSGNLYKLQYYREKNHNLDEFDVPAHEEAERLRDMPGAEDPSQPGDQEMLPVSEQQPPPGPRIPRPKQEAFTLFDDMDDE